MRIWEESLKKNRKPVRLSETDSTKSAWPSAPKERENAVGRVITYIKIVAETVYLVSIYDKSEKSDIPAGELNTLLRQLPE